MKNVPAGHPSCVSFWKRAGIGRTVIMIAQNKKALYEYACLGIALPVVGVLVKGPNGIDKTLSAMLIVAGLALFIWACWRLLAKKAR